MKNQFKPDFDVIVVGAGLSGLTAAYLLAKQGVSVVVLERGEYPGAKNLFGGVLFSTILNRLIPNFWDDAPIERHIVKRRFVYLTPQTEAGFDFKTEKFNQPPYNNSFTVLRAKFDQWFAQKVEQAGAEIYTKVVVDDFIYENGKITGIKARGSRENEYDELRANVVICAEGANSMLAEKVGLRNGKSNMSSQNRAAAVKEIISLPQELIEERFNLSGGEGIAIEYFGDSVKNMLGTGFVYTNKNTISIGVGCTIEDLESNKIALYDLLDYFKNHFAIRKLLEGGEVLEYSAHLIPEDSYNNLPDLVADGLILVGDAAGLVNTSFYHEITNLAMASGLYAAETIIQASKVKEFSKRTLTLYIDKLENSFVLKDMKHYKNFVSFLYRNRQFLTDYPKIFCDSIVDYFSVSETPKSEIKINVIKQARRKINILKFAVDLLRAFRNLT